MVEDINSNGNIDDKNGPLSTTKKNMTLQCDTFRDDVRAEWIRAIFGTEFPKNSQKGEIETAAHAAARVNDSNRIVQHKNGSWKGVGLAGISTYVAYTADLEVPQISAPSAPLTQTHPSMVKSVATATKVDSKSSNYASEKKASNSSTIEKNENGNVSQKSSLLSESQQPSLGMTLSRLSLGLYVRTVRPGSEAWCAGVEPNSVLVGINDGQLNLLAEPSKAALERIWQYEGYCCASIKASENKNKLNIQNNDDWKQRATAITTNEKMKIRDPISMTFIRCGHIYKVLFLGVPPYGIDWGPCGKFCLIQRVKPGGIAERAGVRPSSIVAGIHIGGNRKRNEVNNEDEDRNTIFHLDHSSVAAILKDATSSCIQQQRKTKYHNKNKIRMQLCFPPPEARSGHWERQQDALEENRSGSGKSGGKTKAVIIANKIGISFPQKDKPRPRVAAEIDGVQVRIHPLLGGRGSMIANGRSNSGSYRRSRSPTNHNGNLRYHSGCFVPPSSRLSKLAERVAAGEVLSITRNRDHISHQEHSGISLFSSSGADYGRYYRPCPSLKNSSSLSQVDPNTKQSSSKNQQCPSSSSRSVLDCWDAQQAFIYIFRYHLARYNELETRVRASEDTDILLEFEKYRHQSQSNEMSRKFRDTATPLDFLSTFTIFWFGWLTAQDNKPQELANYLLTIVHEYQISENIGRKINGENSFPYSSFSLVHRMEFLAGAFDNGGIKTSLQKLRKERQQERNLFVNTIESMEDGIKGNKINLIAAKTGTTPIYQNSPGSKINRMFDPKHATSSVGTDSTVAIKTRSLRRFRIFLKKKRLKDKKVSSNESKTASLSNSVDTKQQVPRRKTKTVPPKIIEDLMVDTTRNEKRSESPRFSTNPPTENSPTTILKDLKNLDLKSADVRLNNTLQFLDELVLICVDIEKSLMKSFSQKFARWALQPWSANKESALANVTDTMRIRLEQCNHNHASLPLMDPINSSSEALSSIDTNGCYILPSAHFPLLLTFECKKRSTEIEQFQFQSNNTVFGKEHIYCTTVELIALKGSRVAKTNENLLPRSFTVHASLSGLVVESQQSVALDIESNNHIWDKANCMVFNSRSTWGPPQTLSLRLSETLVETTEKEKIISKSIQGRASKQKECGFCWVNLTPYWEQLTEEHEAPSEKPNNVQSTFKVQVVPFDILKEFNEHGDLPKNPLFESMEKIEIELRIRTKVLETKSTFKRCLLYKHDDDVRQEMFAIEFIKSCDRILRSCGLDMKMLIYECIPVGKRRGFMQWVQGSVPLSEICQPFAGSILAKSSDKNGESKLIGIDKNTVEGTDEVNGREENDDDDNITLSSVAKAGMAKYESLIQLRFESNSSPKDSNNASNYVLPNNNNPIQDFLRSLAYDSDGSYKIKREVMDTYIKSCAGYSVCTYILGVGDRHLDNLLLHGSGHFFHCDYSFILGNDPKKYLPMRISQDMINGMGGWKSDNFCQFLSLACASFLTLRRPENVRHLLSLIRLLEGCGIPDLETTQTIESAIQGVRDRLKLDLTDEEAIKFIEKLIQDSCSSKMWIAVDAIHSLAQKF